MAPRFRLFCRLNPTFSYHPDDWHFHQKWDADRHGGIITRAVILARRRLDISVIHRFQTDGPVVRHEQATADRCPFQVISSYHSPQTNEMLHERSSGVASKSLHIQGMAVDIRVRGTSLVNVHHTALKMARGGVGMYPTSNIVHVDVGRVRQWSGT
jgi:hypothetical protein